MAIPFVSTVRQVLLDLGLLFNDAMLLTASGAGSPTTFVTDEIAGLSADSLKGSEFMPWDVPAGNVNTNLRTPQMVTAHTGSTLTFDRATFSSNYVAGNRGVIQNLNGRGFPQVRKELALKLAYWEMANEIMTSPVYNEVASPSTTDYWNSVPGGLRSVYRITAYWDGQEYEISPSTWQDKIDIGGRRVFLPFPWSTGQTARFYGRADPSDWWGGLRDAVTNSTNFAAYQIGIPVDAQRLILGASKWLLGGVLNDAAARRVEFDYRRQLQQGLGRPWPNEVFFA